MYPKELEGKGNSLCRYYRGIDSLNPHLNRILRQGLGMGRVMWMLQPGLHWLPAGLWGQRSPSEVSRTVHQAPAMLSSRVSRSVSTGLIMAHKLEGTVADTMSNRFPDQGSFGLLL